MVKHQRRSHQRGAHLSELDDVETSDSESGDSPSTPQHSSQMAWPLSLQLPQQGPPHTLHRARSFNEFGQQHYDGMAPQQYHSQGHRHSLSQGQPGLPYQGAILEQHHIPAMQRAPSLPAHSYYVPEQNNPGVATLTPIQTYQLPRQMIDRSFSSVQSSPSTYSSVSRASPVSQEPYYTHQPAQTTTYAIQNPSPIGQQPMIQYIPQPMPQPQQMPVAVSSPQHHQPTAQYHQVQGQNGQWYETVQYQPPVEVISHIQAYPQPQVYNDPWIKIDTYDDPTLQMPSARIESM